MDTNLTLLDQRKTPIAILFDKINVRNNTTLNYLDFDLSEPIAFERFGSTINTKCTVIPKLSSAFYKTQDIFFERLNLVNILSGVVGEVIPSNETNLFELLPKINAAFGVNILQEDIYNTTLPSYSSENVIGSVKVTIVAKPTSFLFVGTYSMVIGPKLQDTTLFPFNVTYFVHTKGYTTPDYLKMLTSINGDGSPNAEFAFLRNATVIDNVSIDKVIQLNDGKMVLKGNFKITVSLNSAPAQDTTCTSMVISPDGAIVSTSSAISFNTSNVIKYYHNKDVGFKYVIDTANTSKTNRIYRYNQDGSLDVNFSPDVIQYVPTLLSVCPDGKMYTVSPTMVAPLSFNNNVPSQQIRIDRINSDGTLDLTYIPVIISGNGNEAPLTVSHIVPLINNGFWMFILPAYGVSSASISPVINGVASVPGGVVDAYSWNPIFRISQTGIVNDSFSKSFRNYLDNSIFNYQGSNLESGDRTFIADETTVTLFSQKSNPITGYEFKQPIVFDSEGKIEFLSGGEYEDLWRWVSAKEIIAEPDGKFVSFGKLSVMALDGTYGPISYCIARYKKSGAIDNLIYEQPVETTLGIPLVLANVLMYKKPTTSNSTIPAITIPGSAIPGQTG